MSEAIQDRCSLPGCTEWFPAAHGKLHCSPAHDRAAARRRKRAAKKVPERAARAAEGECLRPDKRIFPNFAAAQVEADLLGGDRHGMAPYRCSCSQIHVGHAPGAKKALWDYLEDLAWMREFAPDDAPGWGYYPEGRYGPIEQWKLP